jgi:hypothetical protein
LLQEVKRGAVSVAWANERIAEALRQIKRGEELVAQLGPGNERMPLKERCGEALALSEEAAADPDKNRKRAELQTAMTSLERLIEATFLGG